MKSIVKKSILALLLVSVTGTQTLNCQEPGYMSSLFQGIKRSLSFDNLQEQLNQNKWYIAAATGFGLLTLGLGYYWWQNKPALEEKKEEENLKDPQYEYEVVFSKEDSQEGLQLPTAPVAQPVLAEGKNENQDQQEDSSTSQELIFPKESKEEMSNSGSLASSYGEYQPTFDQPIEAFETINFDENIKNGKALVANNFKLNSDVSDDEYLQAIVDILHYIYDAKGEIFDEGTFIIEEAADQALYTFLKNYVAKVYTGDMNSELMWASNGIKAYPGQSSHLNEYYTENKFYGWYYKKAEYTHYRIDVPEAMELPVKGMHHILFGRVNNQKNLFFIRMEPHGLTTQDLPAHSGGFIASLARKVFPSQVSHTLGLGSDDERGKRKERVPQDALKWFKKITSDKIAIKKAKGLGISYMWQCVQNAPDNGPELQNPAAELKALILKKYNDNLDIRIGNEVIIRINDNILK